ncbi:hypothetical protein [Winogradskyella helgolandensis]|uniref:hypothetical protein n=1 Tax=Winogradskyella helgolandensis TaxID=2697010 RepID=UPI0015BAE496|nr:hypothetical protein [Winogradskyella helgolandensis]
MAIFSFSLLLLALLVNEFRHLLRIRKGYAGYNFGFNFSFFIPTTIIALALGLLVISRTLKHWKSWTNLKMKWSLIGLALPTIGFWIYNVLRMIS